LKDYGFLLREDKVYAEKAARIAAKAKDVTELLTEVGLPETAVGEGMRVTYHSACSMQHGQKIKSLPQALLRKAGFTVSDVPEGHLCCGSAGTYNMLQPQLATRLRDRKVANIAKTRPEVIAAGNLGCITQIASGTEVPIVHTVELLDWATGGPKPDALDHM
jgi:glycolate oxidase iron-sulfur subunit